MEKMGHQDKPKATPLMVLKAVGLTISMVLGFGAAFYAGYNSLPYVLAPCIFLEMSSSTCLALIFRYLRGLLFEEKQRKNIVGSYWLGWVMLVVSVVGCLVFAITGFAKMDGFVYEKEGLYASLAPCVLAVFWSAVLIYDAKQYRNMFNSQAGVQLSFYP